MTLLREPICLEDLRSLLFSSDCQIGLTTYFWLHWFSLYLHNLRQEFMKEKENCFKRFAYYQRNKEYLILEAFKKWLLALNQLDTYLVSFFVVLKKLLKS